MLQLVDVGPRSLESYRGIAPENQIEQVIALARDLKGARIAHVNATPYGGGVSELLRSTIPILNDVGIIAHWKTISGDERFFQVTKKLHNCLQGAAVDLTETEREAYLGASRRNAELFEEDYDLVFLHDPQPAAIPAMRGKGSARWIWRCHIDTSAPNPDAWAFLRGYMHEFDGAVFTMRDFVPPDFPVAKVDIIPPAIDPLSPKNMPLTDEASLQVLQWIGIDLSRPLITQISRFDPWKDPLGVIAIYRMLRDEFPGLQLAMVGSMALDDPEGWDIYNQIRVEAHSDPEIHVFTNLIGVGNIEVNAFQRLSQVVIQNSIREGFGLVVSEAMWKNTPVVAGRAGGIPLQMADGVGGLLVSGRDEAAAAIRTLLRDPKEARRLASLGRERVRRQFLLPRLLLNELHLMKSVLEAVPQDRFKTERDPICGMAVPARDRIRIVADRELRFCSEQCLKEFEREPERYVAA